MSTPSLRLPESLHQNVRELAEREGISINQFIATAVAEKMSALLTEERDRL
jgi:predicted HicB family RNase H-like nuclease